MKKVLVAGNKDKGPRHTIFIAINRSNVKHLPGRYYCFLHFNFNNRADYNNLISYLIPAGFYEDKIPVHRLYLVKPG